MVKIITLFLVVIIALAVFGRLNWIGVKRRPKRFCGDCGRVRTGHPCVCGARE